MIRALLYLRLHSAGNWLKSQVVRLRKPQYLLGVAAGVGYFWFLLSGPVADRGGAAGISAGVFLMIALFGAFRIGTAWLAPSPKPGLAFTEAEIAFLFPAPVTRRNLVHYKLAASQTGIVLSAVFLGLLAGLGQNGGEMVRKMVGWWILLSTLHLHAVAAAFTVGRWSDRGLRPAVRRAVILTLVALAFFAVAWVAWSQAPTAYRRWLSTWILLNPGARPGLEQLGQFLGDFASQGALAWLLAPFRVLLAPYFAGTWTSFAIALPGALAIAALHYVWVIRSESAFEEEAVVQAEKRARLVEAVRQGRMVVTAPRARRAPFPLSPAGGWPEIAFLWKNLLATRPWLGPQAFLFAAALVCLVGGLLRRSGGEGHEILAISGAIAGSLAFYVVLIGPQLARQDLRLDLPNLDLLKTYPLRGWRIALGEILTPTAILSGILWLLQLIAALATGAAGGEGAAAMQAVRSLLLALAILTPLFCAIQVLVPNCATLFFPSWAPHAANRNRGLDVLGQRLIFGVGQILLMFLLLGPVALFGTMTWFAASLFASPAVCTAIAFGVVALLLLTEVVLGILCLGRQLERLDLSAEKIG